MACSDNVVRAGFTPKFKDVNTLCSMLTYGSRSPQEQFLQPVQLDAYTRSYVVPVPEFVVDSIEIDTSKIEQGFEYKLEPRESGSILIIIHGEATIQDDKLYPGFVGFIGATTSLTITNIKSNLLAYRAYSRVED